MRCNYDRLNRFASATYDAAGNVLTRTDSRGKVTRYAYDTLNLLISATCASGVPTVYCDGAGNCGSLQPRPIQTAP